MKYLLRHLLLALALCSGWLTLAAEQETVVLKHDFNTSTYGWVTAS